ncbi:MAG: iron-containing alcohol dehydrogenase [Chloroflexota bacterium]|jgi:alcohol dehydrogenase class IV|nr:iron-containing alcohol dehydrogenase [Chloroflexota bacterium]
MRFEFATADRIVFGNGMLKALGDIAPEFGRHALIVTGGGSVPLDDLVSILESSGIKWEIFRVGHEPDVPTVQAGIAQAKAVESEFVIGYGGGSSIDSAKAIAALMSNAGSLMDYLEVIGEGKKIEYGPSPIIAVPTTAGTGAEVTRNAVIASPEFNVKVSMRDVKMIPNIAIVDPELTYTMPPSVTASTGMDAFTQVIEAYVSNRANPLTDAIAREGVQRGAQSLLAAYQDGGNKAAREDMALTSLLGGLALANGGLGAVHGFAGPIGGMFNAPHGVICASLLPYVMKYNVKVLGEKPGKEEILGRYKDIARWMTGNPNAGIEEGVTFILKLAEALSIPGLQEIGIEKEDFGRIIKKSKVSSSMQKNPVELSEDILEAILTEAY